MDNEKAINRLLEVIDVLKEDLSELNQELSDVNSVEGSLEQKIRTLEQKINNLEQELSKIEQRLRKLELKYSKNEGFNERQDPKLQELPTREELDQKLKDKINFRTMIVMGVIISFFASVLGTGITLAVMLYTG